MPISKETKKYQEEIAKKLERLFKCKVYTERDTRLNRNRNEVYSPRIDVIVPPIAEKNGVRINTKCKQLMEQKPYRKFLDSLEVNALNSDLINFSINSNPRYFIGIEIENATSINIKYMLGSITNLHLLCKIGILVVMNPNNRNLKKISEYLKFIREKKKLEVFSEAFSNVTPFSNVVLITREEFDKMLDSMLDARS